MSQKQDSSAIQANSCPFGPDGAGFNPLAAPDRAELHRQLRLARAEAPVFHSTTLNMWVVSRYEDVITILKDSDRFAASARTAILQSFPRVRHILEKTDTFSAPNMGFDGQPAHDQLRAPVARYFTPSAVASRTSRIRARVADCIARLPEGSPVDIIESFATPVAERVVMDLIGFPEGDYEEVVQYHEAISGFFFSSPPVERQLGYAQKITELESYIVRLIEQHRQSPQDDFIGFMLESAETQYGAAELVSLISFDIFAAGIGPTAYVIANLCRELLDNPGRWDELLSRPDLFDDSFTESLRHSGLFPGVFRAVMADAEVGGVVIPAGSVVWALLESADRDESHFAEPDLFIPERPNLAKSLHFSHGLHYCLGVNFVRAVAKVALDLLMRHRPGMRLFTDQVIGQRAGTNILMPTRILVEW